VDKLIEEKIEALWELCGPVDLSTSKEALKKDITKFSNMVIPCRNWLSNRNKLKNVKSTSDSYSLKHEAESDVNVWVPHSVFVFSAFLEGFDLSHSSLRNDVYVVFTNIGAAKRVIKQSDWSNKTL
jgi:hypothetical protein